MTIAVDLGRKATNKTKKKHKKPVYRSYAKYPNINTLLTCTYSANPEQTDLKEWSPQGLQYMLFHSYMELVNSIVTNITLPFVI